MAQFDRSDDQVVVVIGSGAAGGTLANSLCQAGIDVVLLESGPMVPAEEFIRDEWAGNELLGWNDRRLATGGWQMEESYPGQPVWHSEVVGGTSVQWLGVSLRMLPEELRARSTYGAIDGASLIDWPVDANELSSYYDRAEAIMAVSGTHGLPHNPMSENTRRIAVGSKAIGYMQFGPNPLAIVRDKHNGRGPSMQDGFSIQGDRARAKWSTAYTEIPAALATGRMDLRPNCRVVSIEADGDRVSAVLYRDANGQMIRQETRFVVVAANSIESPRILLASANSEHPSGLANGSDMVGRCYMRHVMGTLWSVFDEPVHMNRGESMTGLVADELYHNPERGFSGGYYIEQNAISLPAMARVLDPHLWGRDLTYALDHYASMGGMIAVGEDLPQLSNRVTLDTGKLDAFGVPLASIHYDDHPNDSAMRNHAYDAMEAIHRAAGATRCYRSPPFPATHNLGTVRMSSRPEDGVVDSFGIAHEVKNLMVSGGPIFPTSGAANPTLTIVALALRQADHLADRLKRSGR
ncbi:GMC family oxidoreductase [Pararhodobacter oceanensis]|uniref:GMC family oxidoreductase n=1 Tax=Pararhodobacter oceanensis TaxID=2172121 RepID=UPI003A94DC91